MIPMTMKIHYLHYKLDRKFDLQCMFRKYHINKLRLHHNKQHLSKQQRLSANHNRRNIKCNWKYRQ